MDVHGFDALVRLLAHESTRRAVVPGLGALMMMPLVADAGRKARKVKLCLNGRTIKASRKKKKKLIRHGATPGACPKCTPTCSGAYCGGDDGCGGICGCAAGTVCHTGVCKLCDIACPSGRTGCGAELQSLLISGGTVIACPGRYVGAYTLGTNVMLVGAGDGDDPKTSTILDAQQVGSVVTVPSGVNAKRLGCASWAGTRAQAAA